MRDDEQHMRSILLQNILNDLESLGFARKNKLLILESEETVQTVYIDIFSYGIKGKPKKVSLYDDIEDKLHPKDKSVRISSYGIDIGRLDYTGPPSKTYEFDANSVDYEHSLLHKDLEKYGIKFFEAMKTVDNYYKFLTGDLFRYVDAPLGTWDNDQEYARLALDLAIKRNDKEVIKKAIDIINRSIKTQGVPRRADWIRNHEAFASVKDRFYSP